MSVNGTAFSYAPLLSTGSGTISVRTVSRQSVSQVTTFVVSQSVRVACQNVALHVGSAALSHNSALVRLTAPAARLGSLTIGPGTFEPGATNVTLYGSVTLTSTRCTWMGSGGMVCVRPVALFRRCLFLELPAALVGCRCGFAALPLVSDACWFLPLQG